MIDVRGFTVSTGGGGRASGDGGGCGVAAGNGPAGACALAPVGQERAASPKIPAVMLSFLTVKSIVLIVDTTHLIHSGRAFKKFRWVGEFKETDKPPLP